MTDRETKRLTELLKKKEQEEKAKTEFYKQVRKHRQEVLRELGVTDHPVRPSDNQTDKVLAFLRRQAEKGAAVLAVSHDKDFASGCHYLIEL